MKEKDFQKLFQSMQNITLDDGIRRQVREYLSSYSASKGLPTGSFLVFWRQHAFAYSTAVALFFIFIFGGVAYASQSALPGSPLYGVKVGITEPIQIALADTSEEKAGRVALHISRRFIEAETLLATDALTEAKTTAIVTRLEEHLDSLEETIASLEQQEVTAAERTSRKLSAVLDVHGKILTVLNGGTTESIRALATLRSRRLARVDTPALAAVETERGERSTQATGTSEDTVLMTVAEEAEETDTSDTEQEITIEETTEALESAMETLEEAVELVELDTQAEQALHENILRRFEKAREATLDGDYVQAQHYIYTAMRLTDVLVIYRTLPEVVKARIQTSGGENVFEKFLDATDSELENPGEVQGVKTSDIPPAHPSAPNLDMDRGLVN